MKWRMESMSDRDRMQELIDLYCDADRRGRIESSRDTSPSLVEAYDAMAK